MDHVDFSGLLPPTVPRERSLSSSDIPPIWQACFHLGYPEGGIYMLGLILAQRISEVTKMAWEHIVLEPETEGDEVWHQPGWHNPTKKKKQGDLTTEELRDMINKSRRDHAVPLPPLAVQLLKSIPRVGKYVFIGHGIGDKPCSEGNANVWKKRINDQIEVLIRTRLDDWSFHDFRRTFASTMPEVLEGSEATVERTMNHYMPSAGSGEERERLSRVSGRYNLNKYWKPKKRAMLAWNGHLCSLIAEEPRFPNFKNQRREGKDMMLLWDRVEAVRLRDEEGMNPTDIARKLGYKWTNTVRYTLAKHSSKPLLNPKTKPAMTEEKIARARDLYWNKHKSAKQIAGLLDYSPSRIKRAVRGGRPPGAERPPITYRQSAIPPDDLARMFQLKDENKEYKEIAEITDYPKSTVHWAMNRDLVKTRKRKIGPNELAEAARLRLDDGLPFPKVIELTGLSRSVVFRAVREEKERRQPSLPLGEAAD